MVVGHVYKRTSLAGAGRRDGASPRVGRDALHRRATASVPRGAPAIAQARCWSCSRRPRRPAATETRARVAAPSIGGRHRLAAGGRGRGVRTNHLELGVFAGGQDTGRAYLVPPFNLTHRRRAPARRPAAPELCQVRYCAPGPLEPKGRGGTARRARAHTHYSCDCVCTAAPPKPRQGSSLRNAA